MNRPSEELLDRYNANYKPDTAFAANARLLQCQWASKLGLRFAERSHEVKGARVVLPPLWNYIDTTHEASVRAAFLSEQVHEVVQRTLAENDKAKGKARKVIRKDRLLGNLLSSQPLAFNLFAELSLDLDRATRVFQQVLGKPIDRITSIQFEHSPGRGDVRFTGDHSAMDVFVEYSAGGKRGFVGIEVKYAEHLKDKPATPKDRYVEVALASGAFPPASLEKLKGMPKSIEQIWRDHLLCLSMVQAMPDTYDEGVFMFLYPSLNAECDVAVKRYEKLLGDKSTFKPVHMEDVVKAIAENGGAEFAEQFWKRYLAFDDIY
jgi:hypothetical protein